jgi:signal transduction histidine kinase
MVVRYDPALANKKTYEALFPALVRRITTIDSNGLLFGGTFADEGGRLTSAQRASLVPQLAFEHNALRFEFALPSYNDVAGNEFQYYLEGKDDHWSGWTSETTKNYTNLVEGTYSFHIRGRNAQGFISSASEYAFTILPPWYRSVWAYGIYLLGFVGTAMFIRRHRLMVVENMKAREQAEELAKEREVNERLNDLNHRLKQANESLVQADRLKDEFLANTSHELRTPLTGILGCAAILAEEVNDEQKEFIEMIDQNGHRLLHTLDSLLELARLRAGLLELEFVTLDVGSRAYSVAGTYRPVVEKKAVTLNVSVDGDLSAWMDDHCLQCVLHHLIGNAVKFTDEGTIDVSIRRNGDQILLMVVDTGIGIEDAFLPFLFDEFKQESTGLTRSHEGNGLGLAVTARILDLMGGEIEVQSQKGVGTTFTVYLPVDHAGYAPTGDGYTSMASNVQLEAQGGGPDRAAA